MRIVFMNSVRQWGGGLTSALALARGLAVHHDVTVACNARSDLRRHLEDDAVRVAPIRIGPDYDPLAALSFVRAVRRANADVIILDRRKDVKLFLVASLLGLRTPAVHRNGAPSGLRDAVLYRAAWSRLGAMVVNSEAMRRQLLESSPWLASLTIEVVYNGVDAERFQPAADQAAARTAIGVPPDAFVIAYSGVLQVRKRIDLLIRSIAAMPTDIPKHLLLIGAGDERPELARLAEDLDVPVTFAGRRADVAACLGAADVVAHLSSAEGFSNSVLEALACGLPVVATDEHSHPEQIDDGVTGILTRPDTGAIANALTTLARDPTTRATMARAARESADARFAIPRMVDGYVQVLERVARNHQP